MRERNLHRTLNGLHRIQELMVLRENANSTAAAKAEREAAEKAQRAQKTLGEAHSRHRELHREASLDPIALRISRTIISEQSAASMRADEDHMKAVSQNGEQLTRHSAAKARSELIETMARNASRKVHRGELEREAEEAIALFFQAHRRAAP